MPGCVGEALGAEARDAESASPSLTTLFNNLAQGGGAPSLFGRRIRVLLRPGEPIGRISPMRGDLLLRTVPGHGWTQLGFVASPGFTSGVRIPELGLRPESDPRTSPGRYAHVVELWPMRRSEGDRRGHAAWRPPGASPPGGQPGRMTSPRRSRSLRSRPP